MSRKTNRLTQGNSKSSYMIEKFATKADALTGKVAFIAWSLGFVTVNQIGEKYYNVFEQLGLHHSLFS